MSQDSGIERDSDLLELEDQLGELFEKLEDSKQNFKENVRCFKLCYRSKTGAFQGFNESEIKERLQDLEGLYEEFIHEAVQRLELAKTHLEIPRLLAFHTALMAIEDWFERFSTMVLFKQSGNLLDACIKLLPPASVVDNGSFELLDLARCLKSFGLLFYKQTIAHQLKNLKQQSLDLEERS